jgi:hypothetical protein
MDVREWGRGIGGGAWNLPGLANFQLDGGLNLGLNNRTPAPTGPADVSQ